MSTLIHDAEWHATGSHLAVEGDEVVGGAADALGNRLDVAEHCARRE